MTEPRGGTTGSGSGGALAPHTAPGDGPGGGGKMTLITVSEPDRGSFNMRSSALQTVTWLDGPNDALIDPTKAVALRRSINRKPAMSQETATEDYLKGLASTS